jgi:hypothetical protein
MLALNAGAAIYVGGKADSLRRRRDAGARDAGSAGFGLERLQATTPADARAVSTDILQKILAVKAEEVAAGKAPDRG